MSYQVMIGIAVALVVVGFFLILPGIWRHTPAELPASTTEATLSQPTLSIVDTVVGNGAEAKAGDMVVVRYVGKLEDGTVFDRSDLHGGTFSFTLGAGQVIRGWDEGFAGMKVGGTRILTIPPELGYGSRTIGPIPANSTLTFEVELVNVESPAAAQ